MQRRLLKRKDQAEALAEDWYKRAQLALINGNENLSREALSRRQIQLDEAETLQVQIDAQAKSIDKLYEGMQALEKSILDNRAKKGELAARARKAKAQKNINDMVSSITTSKVNGILGSINGKMTAVEAFDRMEEKVEALEAAAEASAEMASLASSGNLFAPGSDTTSEMSLEQQFKLLEGSSTVDKEFKKMKGMLKASSSSSTSIPISSSTSSSSSSSSRRRASVPHRSVESELDNLKKKVSVTWDE